MYQTKTSILQCKLSIEMRRTQEHLPSKNSDRSFVVPLNQRAAANEIAPSTLGPQQMLPGTAVLPHPIFRRQLLHVGMMDPFVMLVSHNYITWHGYDGRCSEKRILISFHLLYPGSIHGSSISRPWWLGKPVVAFLPLREAEDSVLPQHSLGGMVRSKSPSEP